MMRKVVFTIVAGALATMSYAQEPMKSNAHIGFIYPLSTNGVHAPEYSNMFSMHAISGVSRSEEAFCMSGIASVVKDTAKGFIGSGVANVVVGSSYGIQMAGIVNYNGHYMQGVQASGCVNITKDIDGVQAAGLANVAYGTANGFQASGFANYADSTHGQGAGFVNVAGSTGVQAAGFVNVAECSPVQAAGFINVAERSKVQVAGFINVAEEVKGTQLAGFINVAGKVKGVQLAGFINVADSCDFPIGLINIIGNGEQAIGVSVNEVGTTIAAFRSGGRRLYGIVGVGGNFTGGYSAFSLQLGMGLRVPVSRTFRINTEVSVTSLSDRWGNTDIRSGVRVMPSVRVGMVEVFAGPSFNYTATSDIQGLGRVGYSVWSYESRHYSEDLSFGFEAGIQLHLNNQIHKAMKRFKKSSE